MRNMLGIIFGGLISIFWFVSGALLAGVLLSDKKPKPFHRPKEESKPAQADEDSVIKHAFPDWDEPEEWAYWIKILQPGRSIEYECSNCKSRVNDPKFICPGCHRSMNVLD